MPCMGQTICFSRPITFTIHKKKQYYKKIEENFTVANLATDLFSQSPNPNSQSPLATIRSPMSSPAIAIISLYFPYICLHKLNPILQVLTPEGQEYIYHLGPSGAGRQGNDDATKEEDARLRQVHELSGDAPAAPKVCEHLQKGGGGDSGWVVR